MQPDHTKITKMSLILSLGLLVCSATSLALAAEETNDGSSDNRIEVGVYFESKCPDSKNFFLDQLVPTYREIGNQTLKLLLVPFGHARVLSREKMICQHGYRECEGNKLMACMLGQGSSDSEVLESIGCLFENRSSPKECISKHMPTTPYDTVERCAKDHSRTYELMLAAEKMTGRVNYVPHITIDGESTEEIRSQAEWNLKNYICKIYKGTQPEACKNSSATSQRS